MATTSNDTSGTIISAHFVYKITFGNSITASNSQIKELTLEQGVSTTFQDKSHYMVSKSIRKSTSPRRLSVNWTS